MTLNQNYQNQKLSKENNYAYLQSFLHKEIFFNDGRQANVVYVTKNYQMFNFSKFNRNVFLSPEFLKQAEIGLFHQLS